MLLVYGFSIFSGFRHINQVDPETSIAVVSVPASKIPDAVAWNRPFGVLVEVEVGRSREVVAVVKEAEPSCKADS